MGVRYPDRIPPALAEVLGLPPYQLWEVAMALRELGFEVPARYEGETGSALHFLIPIALSHPDDWRPAAAEELLRLKAGGQPDTSAMPGWYR
ncbi:hypothetical protein [uncultured Sphingomonas sp.]|uniref:hypothetical protein n=1 Tax=uncultured Sphingomonas sp. TaxID=158754 RepID=UPI0025F51464|nr:hypothetical protein [uncultured Sphingomonas sp.]